MRNLILLCALGSGLVSGVFFAFSTFVMPALARLPREKAVAAMQAINVAAVTPAFMALFMGTTALCAITAVAGRTSPLILAAALLYLLGTFAVTAAFNVPLNDALAPLKPESPEAADLWPRYLRAWTAWNHLRTLASLASTALFILAIQRSAAP